LHRILSGKIEGLKKSWLFNDVAKKNKHFKKRRHILAEEQEVFYDDGDEDLGDNLMKKNEYTEVTAERFAGWLRGFRAEMRIKQQRDPVFLRKQAVLSKPTGRMIFNDRLKDFGVYYDDDKNDDDDVVGSGSPAGCEHHEGDEAQARGWRRRRGGDRRGAFRRRGRSR
jgi:hypothetical protein